jgi:hypothetical protein
MLPQMNTINGNLQKQQRGWLVRWTLESASGQAVASWKAAETTTNHSERERTTTRLFGLAAEQRMNWPGLFLPS